MILDEMLIEIVKSKPEIYDLLPHQQVLNLYYHFNKQHSAKSTFTGNHHLSSLHAVIP